VAMNCSGKTTKQPLSGDTDRHQMSAFWRTVAKAASVGREATSSAPHPW
jgi:hypothetical protein